jgi:toxin ParE1/3/4
LKRVVVTRPARREIIAGVRWYERVEEGLGTQFIEEVEVALNRIAAKPTACPLWRDDRLYRKGRMRRFPYVIFFREYDKTIRIVAVAHKRRRPGYWLARDDE